MELFFLTAGNKLKEFRKEQYDKQGGICPILKKWVPFEDTVVDHLHASKTAKAGISNAHMVRGIIHNGCNSAEGRFLGAFKRSGLAKIVSFSDYLRGLADYIDNPPLIGSGYVHPEGKPKPKTFGKREYARVKKYWSQMYPKKKMPEWKDSGRKKQTGKMRMTKPFEQFIKEANKIHYEKYK